MRLLRWIGPEIGVNDQMPQDPNVWIAIGKGLAAISAVAAVASQ